MKRKSVISTTSLRQAVRRRTAQLLLRLLIGNARVFVVVGARRSGNHAFVGWLTNALESAEVTLLRDETFSHLYRSESKGTVHINDISELSPFGYFMMVYRRRREIRRSKFLVLSYEDSRISDVTRSITVPRNVDSHFVIRRSTLNLVSSRYRSLARAAGEGRGQRLMNVDEKFLDTLIEYDRLADSTWIPWWFDQWVDDSCSFRSTFLRQCELTFDSVPPVSSLGGGSSFDGLGAAKASSLTKRYEEVELPLAVVARLLDERYRKLLDHAEVKHLTENYPLHS